MTEIFIYEPVIFLLTAQKTSKYFVNISYPWTFFHTSKLLLFICLHYLKRSVSLSHKIFAIIIHCNACFQILWNLLWRTIKFITVAHNFWGPNAGKVVACDHWDSAMSDGSEFYIAAFLFFFPFFSGVNFLFTDIGACSTCFIWWPLYRYSLIHVFSYF